MDNLRDHKSCKPVVLKEVETGKLVSISNLYHFCESKKINYQGIKNLFYNLKGENHLTCNGYCLPETSRELIRLSKLTQKWKEIWNSQIRISNFRTKEDVVLTKSNILEFCDKNKIKPRMIWNLYSGEATQHKGWYKTGSKIKARNQLHSSPVRLVSPDGLEIEISNVCSWVRNEFAPHLSKEDAHKKYRSFHKLVKGESKKAYGYTMK